MPRKSIDSIEAARRDIKKRYKRGRKVERKITAEASLSEVDRLAKKEIACYLKAQDFSYTYIADSLGVSKNVVQKWFAEPEMQERYEEVLADIVGAAAKLLKSYAIEFIEMLAEIARTTPDDKIALQAITEGLDRMGLAKVNKSESVSAQTIREEREVDITDKNGLLEALKDAPPEAQAAAAKAMEDLFAVATEHVQGEEVTSAPQS